jgi:HNH endonuclease
VDPLTSIHDKARQGQLSELRRLDGALLSSDQLRATLPGFRGQKGIYKPRGSKYALWVRQTLRGIYADREPVINPDGSWVYDYAPEGRRGQPDMTLDTNRALLKCMEDQVPIGVIRQIPSPAGSRLYEVKGLGYVTGFDGTHFRLSGEPIDFAERPMTEAGVLKFEPFDKTFPLLAMTIQKIREERFKLAIRRVYHERCSLCNIGYHLGHTPLAVEAAHLIPFQEGGTSKDVRNGILLCSNHHALFDNFAWVFDEDLRVQVTRDSDFRNSARSNHVLRAEGQRLTNLPDSSTDNPDPFAIRYRMELFNKHQ